MAGVGRRAGGRAGGLMCACAWMQMSVGGLVWRAGGMPRGSAPHWEIPGRVLGGAPSQGGGLQSLSWLPSGFLADETAGRDSGGYR